MEFSRPETGPPGYNAARLLTQIPPPRRHLLFYYGHYSNVARGRRGKTQPHSVSQATTPSGPEDQTTLSPARKAVFGEGGRISFDGSLRWTRWFATTVEASRGPGIELLIRYPFRPC